MDLILHLLNTSMGRLFTKFNAGLVILVQLVLNVNLISLNCFSKTIVSLALEILAIHMV